MAQYVYAWITVAVLSVLSELLLPGGKGGKMAGHMRFLAGLCVLIALLPVVKDGLAHLRDLAEGDYEIVLPEGEKGDYEACFRESLADLTKEQYEVWVYDTLQREFAIDKENCVAEVTVAHHGDGVPSITAVFISLSGKAILKDPRQIESRIGTALSVPCMVSVDLNEA